MPLRPVRVRRSVDSSTDRHHQRLCLHRRNRQTGLRCDDLATAARAFAPLLIIFRGFRESVQVPKPSPPSQGGLALEGLSDPRCCEATQKGELRTEKGLPTRWPTTVSSIRSQTACPGVMKTSFDSITMGHLDTGDSLAAPMARHAVGSLREAPRQGTVKQRMHPPAPGKSGWEGPCIKNLDFLSRQALRAEKKQEKG